METHLLLAVAHIHSVSYVNRSAPHALVPPGVHLEHAYVRNDSRYVRVSGHACGVGSDRGEEMGCYDSLLGTMSATYACATK